MRFVHYNDDQPPLAAFYFRHIAHRATDTYQMKIMSDDEVTMDSMDTEEDIFTPRSRSLGSVARKSKSLRTLRSRVPSSPLLNRNVSSVRRSTRNRMQTYDNLNTSWILGTQTLKGYPMFRQPGSSSDKEMVEEVNERKRELKRRIPLKSRENHPLNKGPTRHIRALRDRELRDRPDRSKELRERQERDKESRDRPNIDKESLEKHEQDEESRDGADSVTESKEGPRQDEDRSEKELKDRGEKDCRNKTELTAGHDEKEIRRTKSLGSPRLREGPVTRYMLEKDEKPKAEQNDDEDSSQESHKPHNNDNSDNEDGYEDMYTRIKRTKRATQRQLQRDKKLVEESDLSESSDSPGPRKYSLRQKKPAVDRFQASVEPVQRSFRVLRSVLTNSMRRCKHRGKTTSSSDSSDSEPQRYDKKKGKKARQSAIPQGGPPDRKADIDPITVDTNITFNDVGGLESHIHCLKEMVVFPMIYPDVFDRFHITPPKGVLFHGPPGTGKTLIARALANECSRGSRKVSFFMRKGADCLSKWVGESERQLRLLFEQAQQKKPSIIFFDEIDGLAPVRSTKQDQIHASIVSTLLALMDGLCNRGEVIVIGATNRIDAIDPALRRPGRFDRELFFPLPPRKERLEILKIHVSKWENPPSPQLLEALAEKSTGYCGSDLRALCTEAVLQGLRRTYPQIYMTSDRLLLDPTQVEVKKRDFVQASSILVPSSHRVAPCAGRKLQPFLEPLLNPALETILDTIKRTFPQGIKPAMAKIKIVRGIHRPRLLIAGGYKAKGQGPHLAPAILYRMEHLPVHTLDVSTLFAETARSPEEACVQVFNEASRNVPSIIYIPAIDQWWPLVPETVKAVFLCRIMALDPTLPILILSTSDTMYECLPLHLRNLFSKFRGEVYTMRNPMSQQRAKFFRPIYMVQSLKPPPIKNNKVAVLEKLPLAPEFVPKRMTEEERISLYEKEEASLRELRIFLREICAKLARNRQFFMFTKPVDTEEVPDYNMIIKQPMDLETMMTKIDMHCYLCARDFLDDVDLICRNALEYNPDSLRDRPSLGILKRDPADKLIRHRACSLRDNAYALIKAELDSDFEDKCREISKNRKVTENIDGDAESKSSKTDSLTNTEKNDKKESPTPTSGIMVNGKKFSTSRKRRIPAWARGYVKKVHKKKKIAFDDMTTEIVRKSSVSMENTSGIDLEKFQEFETEANSVLNGNDPLFNNSDSDNDLQFDTPKDSSQSNHNEADKDKKNDEIIEMDVTMADDQRHVENEGSSASSRRESMDELSFAIESDSSPTKNGVNEKVIVDKSELETALKHTVDITEDSPVEVLCDIYVQLSRCVGKYTHYYDRTSLPKDLLKELKRFEECETTAIHNEAMSVVHATEVGRFEECETTITSQEIDILKVTDTLQVLN
ncbi:ATPase family AAA domain-containing protein 2-like isoform X1 [Neodiprion fabricii]|uniref:ATPase family AAA domain-containing protein 2-like isoform X1 n=2 Tax=Neodiprion fabricii TaxID=2872261 RepID=UPI001ED95986|nr:ATPase family AAA domain-containing protein 2-like isoform X1 [Neodiprion fabricii]XP_046418585.1 ATPase family AAA domain-containing protein 2-like isoform X1 [Neodiprion fabricii]